MQKLKAPMPQQYRSLSLPKINPVKDNVVTAAYSKAYLEYIKKTCIPTTHEFLYQARPAKVIQMKVKNIIKSVHPGLGLVVKKVNDVTVKRKVCSEYAFGNFLASKRKTKSQLEFQEVKKVPEVVNIERVGLEA